LAEYKRLSRLNAKQMNIYNCWEEDVNITPGQLTESGGKYAVISLQAAVHALKQNHIDGLVTAPIHKKTYNQLNSITRVIPFFKKLLGVNDVVMLLFANEFSGRIGY
jgi:4-hydroxythreonine-4-phosphate dehydrogenase